MFLDIQISSILVMWIQAVKMNSWAETNKWRADGWWIRPIFQRLMVLLVWKGGWLRVPQNLRKSLPFSPSTWNFLLLWSKYRTFFFGHKASANGQKKPRKRGKRNAAFQATGWRFRPNGGNGVPRNFSTLPPSVGAFLFSLKIREKKLPQKKLISNQSRYGRHTVYFFVEGFPQI